MSPRHPWQRLRAPVAAAVAATGATAGLIALRIGLLGGPLVGVGDNGDGYRLFCTAGIRPDVPGLDAAWRGVVVTRFTTGYPACDAPWTSAGAILRAAVGGGSDGGAANGGAPIFSLAALGWVFVVLAALGAGAAAAALAATAPRRAVLVALPVLPLVVVGWWSRFDVSTYAEPAGLLGTAWVLLGLVVVAATGPTARGPRATALALLALGGLVAATAKPGFVPVGAAAALVAATVTLRSAPTRSTRPRPPRPHRLPARAAGPLVAGPLVAVAVLALAAPPVVGALRAQDEGYAAINVHNLLFTALAVERGPGVLTAVGLPPAAAAEIGESFYWAGARNVPAWGAAIGDRPLAARAQARALLRDDPGLLATMVGRGLTATMRPALDYLPSAPRGTVPERNERRTVYPDAGPLTGLQLADLDAIAFGWLPAALAGAALLAGAVSFLPRRRRPPGRSAAIGLVRAAAVAAALAVAVVALAVIGDGYYELTKHVWLASYLLVEVALLGLAALLVGPAGHRVISRVGRRGR